MESNKICQLKWFKAIQSACVCVWFVDTLSGIVECVERLYNTLLAINCAEVIRNMYENHTFIHISYPPPRLCYVNINDYNTLNYSYAMKFMA